MAPQFLGAGVVPIDKEVICIRMKDIVMWAICQVPLKHEAAPGRDMVVFTAMNDDGGNLDLFEKMIRLTQKLQHACQNRKGPIQFRFRGFIPELQEPAIYASRGCQKGTGLNSAMKPLWQPIVEKMGT